MAVEIETLRDLYVHQLRDLYSAENQIVKALPKFIKKVTSPELKNALENHLQETLKQVDRLDQIFESMDSSPRGKKCVGMEGVLDEGKEAMAEKMSPELMDAALLGECQKMEHYEISAYGTARAFAILVGEDHAVDLLGQTLEEEQSTDAKLTEMAMNMINPSAIQEYMAREHI